MQLSSGQSISVVFGAQVGHFAVTPQSDIVGIWSCDLGAKRPTRIQLYQFEPVRQDFERVQEHRVSFDMRYSMGFAKSHSLKCSLHKWA